MGLVFATRSDAQGDIESFGSMYALVGTLTFSGSYATGGDTFPTGKDPETLFKKIGLGKVAFVLMTRGYQSEWDATAKKLKLYSAANTELTAAAYNAALTASPVPVIILGR
jgi:uncharacterized membrane protein